MAIYICIKIQGDTNKEKTSLFVTSYSVKFAFLSKDGTIDPVLHSAIEFSSLTLFSSIYGQLKVTDALFQMFYVLLLPHALVSCFDTPLNNAEQLM